MWRNCYRSWDTTKGGLSFKPSYMCCIQKRASCTLPKFLKYWFFFLEPIPWKKLSLFKDYIYFIELARSKKTAFRFFRCNLGTEIYCIWQLLNPASVCCSLVSSESTKFRNQEVISFNFVFLKLDSRIHFYLLLWSIIIFRVLPLDDNLSR